MFDVEIAAIADVETHAGKRSLKVEVTSPAVFTGITVVAANLEPKIGSASEARDVVAEFLALDGLEEPRSEQWKFVLEPTRITKS